MTRITCPQCQFSADLPEGFRFPQVKCPKCKTVFPVAAPEPVAEPATEDLNFTEQRIDARREQSGDEEYVAKVRLSSDERLSKRGRSAGRWLIGFCMFCLACAGLQLYTMLVVAAPMAKTSRQENILLALKAFSLAVMLASVALGLFAFQCGFVLFRRSRPPSCMVRMIVVGSLALPVGLFLLGIGSLAIVGIARAYDKVGFNATQRMVDSWLNGLMAGAACLAFGVTGIVAGTKSIAMAIRIFKNRNPEQRLKRYSLDELHDDDAG